MTRHWGIAALLIPIALLFAQCTGRPPARTFQNCRGASTLISPNQTFPLTCNVTTPLGGAQILVLPEMWVPGNGCIVTTDKPRVVMVGNNFGVTATFTNRCGSGYQGSEGGLAWEIVQIAP